MSVVLPLAPNEHEFLDHLNGAGKVVPELLTEDPLLRAIIQEHPGIRWKALNARKNLGFSTTEEP